jgi:CRISPR system Cascade subunit CasD
MGVRVNRAGVPQKDFHTAGGSRHDDYGVVTAGGGKGGTVVSTRHYLADADFLVGLESDDEEFLQTLDTALARPVWQIFLGRKSFVPGCPVRVGVQEGLALVEALLCDWPRLRDGTLAPRLRCVLEPLGEDPDAATVRHDVPLCFATRQFTLRSVKTVWQSAPKGGDEDATATV